MNQQHSSHEHPRWFSANPSKAWGEKFFLCYSPIWMAGMGVTMVSGATAVWGDTGFLLQALALWLPLFLVPAWLRDERDLGRRWFETYWFKANLWLGAFAFAGSYFMTEYFFDVLGMVYEYPNVDLNFDSALLGSGSQRVPLVMFFYAHVYFTTYHVTAQVVLRRIRTANLVDSKFARTALWSLAVVLVAYSWAWLETRAMANEMIEQQFRYRDLDRMLAYGSIFYACYFIVSFPMFYRLDEPPDDRWPLARTFLDAMAASMLVMFLLDFWTLAIGPI